MAPTIVASARSRGCRTLSVPRRRNGSLPRSSRIRRIAKAPPRRGWSCRRLRRVRGLSRRSTVALARLRSNRHARSPCRRLCSEGGGRSHFWALIGRSETKSNRRFADWPAVVAAIGLNATDHAIGLNAPDDRDARGCRDLQTSGSNAKRFRKHFSGLRFRGWRGRFDGLDRSDLASDDRMPASQPLPSASLSRLSNELGDVSPERSKPPARDSRTPSISRRSIPTGPRSTPISAWS